MADVIVVTTGSKRPKVKAARERKPKATKDKKPIEVQPASPVGSGDSAANSENEDNEIIEEEEMNEESEEEEEHEEEKPKKPKTSSAPKTKKTKEPPALETFINQTVFDVYFTHSSIPARISSNQFSSLVEPLTSDEILVPSKHTRYIQLLSQSHQNYFPHFWLELHSGFNLLFYGYGSKRELLTLFGKEYCAKHGHVVVVNGYLPRTNYKSVLTALETVPGLLDLSLEASGLEGQIGRVYDFFRDTSNPPLYMIVHNIESPSLRDQRARNVFSTLSLHPRIHLIASIDHIQTPLLWSTSESTTRKHALSSTGTDIPKDRGYAWLFHELTTFQPYVRELKRRDITALPSNQLTSGSGAAVGQALTESAMLHILASVTEKAKRLFKLLADKQISSVSAEGGKPALGAGGMEKYGMQYDLLFNEARKEFLATSDTALRALLGEFMDHEMVKSGGQPEILWIPAAKDPLKRVLQGIAT